MHFNNYIVYFVIQCAAVNTQKGFNIPPEQ